MSIYYPLEVLIKKNLNGVVEGIKDVNRKSKEYTRNPGIKTLCQAKMSREVLSLLIEEATKTIHKEWEDKYKDIISESELQNLTKNILENLCEQLE